MASPSLPPVATLSTASEDTLKFVLDTLFEPSRDLHAIAISSIREQFSNHNTDTPFTYTTLIQHVGSLLSSLASTTTPESRATLHAILGSHPRLGAKKVESVQSRAEQAQLNAGAGAGAEEEAAQLAALNAEYEARFPGLRYVVFVNGRGRPIIMRDMQERIARGDVRAEEREAIRAMVDIALDRARKLGAVDG
ncbi:hypothetical protein DL766_000498 [Monosporascus sp. MC13-8B]|uniref:Oxo-4-hydroxy-4-carboxy-5-ureidoimidazoline decarboxylase domain-containing protein n=1 Tax=Monosporascus cannonballus TaxID=155416 RepID=A0ABY0GQE3_9PEZI|nr:hypothetical protein DL762_010445 [Monosporascus cannonballus]RYO76436.1 hypothetical protein DL763_010477 [Monosporascus cannonballus]RYP39240.1 hypothetical protein DL766_000498 [Monosporascus sp. MC13-8B]